MKLVGYIRKLIDEKDIKQSFKWVLGATVRCGGSIPSLEDGRSKK